MAKTKAKNLSLQLGTRSAGQLSESTVVNLPLGDGFIRESEVLARIPFGRSTLWLKVKRGEFPAPVKLSERVTAWEVAAIKRWIAERLQTTQRKVA